MVDTAAPLPAFFSEAASSYLKLQRQFEAKCAEHNELLAHIRSFRLEFSAASAGHEVLGDASQAAAAAKLGTSSGRPNVGNAGGEAVYVDLASLKRTLGAQFDNLRSKVEDKEHLEVECHRALHENNVLQEKISRAERQIQELEAKVTMLEIGKNDDDLSLFRAQEENLKLREQAGQILAESEEAAATTANLRAQLQATKKWANDALTGENEVSQALLLIDQQARRLRRELHNLRRKQNEASPVRVNPSPLLPDIKPKVNIRRYLRLQDILPKQLLLDTQREQFCSRGVNLSTPP
eukprot:GEMP01045569.1.p1 GENE.GEMP01045569.1~~GEMP01045569.1.p1  ORF type:complete len:295 (+),score=78.63 GEMP01045569.1:62-946(+)